MNETEELAKCMDSFEYFLRNYVVIRDVRRTGGVEVTRALKWEWWPHHEEVVRDLMNEPRIVMSKSRQIGASWGDAAWMLHGAMFTPGFLGGLSSQGEDEAIELLGKCRYIYEHFEINGKRVQLKAKTDNTLVLEFTGLGKLMAFPSTEKAGHGLTFNRVLMDEAAFHEYAEDNYVAFSGATEHGQMIVVSSSGNGQKVAVSDFFERLWKGGAYEGPLRPEDRQGLTWGGDKDTNGFKARFYGWQVRPGRDEAWYEEQRVRLKPVPGALQREYPNDPDEAFRSMMARRFDVDAVAHGRAHTYAGIHVDVPDGLREPYQKGYLRLWQKPRVTSAYVIYSDAALGVGRDYCATVVLDANTLQHVATLRDNDVEPTTHGGWADHLARWYNSGLWGVESNRGEAIIHVAAERHYPRKYWHESEPTYQQMMKGEKPTKRIGFPVTEHTRVGLLDDLGAVIASYTLTSPDVVFWDETGSFIVNKNGRSEAAPGHHDDMPMAMAGAVRMTKVPGARQMAGEYATTGRNYMGGF